MKYGFMALVLAGIALLAIAFEPRPIVLPESPLLLTAGTVTIASTTVVVEIADSAEERMQGLSDRQVLAEGSGMLFVFESEGDWGFWMKDMHFSIDIIWADAEGRIVTVTPGVAPETYPNAFYPSEPAQYVLEVPAGFAAAQGIAEGQQLVVEYLERVE